VVKQANRGGLIGLPPPGVTVDVTNSPHRHATDRDIAHTWRSGRKLEVRENVA
jgi:hypothetical protein